MNDYPCYYCSKWGPCPMCQEKHGLDENGHPKTSPYRKACPPPIEPMSITLSDDLSIPNTDIIFKCNACKAEWRLTDTFNLHFNAEAKAFWQLQQAWEFKHRKCQ